jgi:hypothetical protein
MTTHARAVGHLLLFHIRRDDGFENGEVAGNLGLVDTHLVCCEMRRFIGMFKELPHHDGHWSS